MTRHNSSIKIFLFLILLLNFISVGADDGKSDAIGGNFNFGFVHNLKDNDNAYSLDFNYTWFLVTASAGVRSWSKKDDLELYVAYGFSFANIVALQLGFSSDSNLIYRIAFNPIIPDISYPSGYERKWGFRKGLSVNLFFESSFEREPDMLIGIGLGLIF
jgi:hypothetical protein